MSDINNYPLEALVAMVTLCAENPSSEKAKKIIKNICKKIDYKRENIVVLKFIFQTKAFYPLPECVFFSSCTNGLIELVECLIENMEKDDIPKSHGPCSIIYETLMKDHIDIAKLLIKNKIFKTFKGIPDINGLGVACEKGFLEIVKLLLEAGIVPNNDSMYKATINGHYEIVNLLLNYPNVEVHHAIEIAIIHNYENIVKLILQKRTNKTPADFNSNCGYYKKLVSIYNELYAIDLVKIPVSSNEVPLVEIPESSVEISIPLNNIESLNDSLKKLQKDMIKQNIYKISITSNSILITNNLI